MFLKYIFTALFLLSGFAAEAEENSNYLDEDIDYENSLFFVGVIEKATLIPKNYEEEAKRCSEINGFECILITPDCGTKIIDFRVIENIYGTQNGDKIKAKEGLERHCTFELNTGEVIAIIQKSKELDEFSIFDSTINIYLVHRNENLEKYFFLEYSYEFAECQEITGVNCYNLLKSVETIYFGTMDDYNFMDPEERNILESNEEGEIYMTHAIFINDLLRQIKLKDAGLK